MAYDNNPYLVDCKSVGPLKVKVSVDDSGSTESPREYADNTMFITAHNRHSSPDKFTGDDTVEHLATTFDVWHWDNQFKEHTYETDVDKLLNEVYRKAVIVPVYMFEHSNVAYRASTTGNPFHCRWDSGMVGFIYMKREDILQEYGVKIVHEALRDRVIEHLKIEAKEYSDWAEGNVYKYSVELNGDHVASCHGFIGDSDYALEAGVEEAWACLRYACKQRQLKLKQLIAQQCPLGRRERVLGETYRAALVEAD